MTIPLRQLEGKYEILEKISEGGMGAVYKVRHLLLDELRVIKIIKPQLAHDAPLQQRFLHEAKTAIRLRHSNIAHLYDFTVDEEEGTSFIVMEFIDGATFQNLVRCVGALHLPLALEAADQALQAIGFLHDHGYVHRDIAPDNLMLSRTFIGKPLVKLIDLGIAKRLEGDAGLTQTGMFIGKVRYASPEHFRGDRDRQQDLRSDLYSFGVVFYELLTGRCPIEGDNLAELAGAHLFQPPLDFAKSDPGGRIAPDLREAVLKTLAKEPEERIGSAAELRELIRPFRTSPDEAAEGLEELLSEAAVLAPVKPERSEPGSTQSRLDRQFGAVATPMPEDEPIEPTDAPPPPVDQTVTVLPSDRAGDEPTEVVHEAPAAAEASAGDEGPTERVPAGGDESAAGGEPAGAADAELAASGEGLGEPSDLAFEAEATEVGDRSLVELDLRREAESAIRVGDEALDEPIGRARAEPLGETGEAAGEEPHAPRRSRAAVWSTVVVLLVLVAGLGWWLSRDRASAPAAAGPAASVESRLVIDALPWAEVTAIVGEDGEPVDLVGDASTPLAIRLPSGRYEVTLRNPGYEPPVRTVEVEIPPGETLRETVPIGTVDVDRFLGREAAPDADPPG